MFSVTFYRGVQGFRRVSSAMRRSNDFLSTQFMASSTRQGLTGRDNQERIMSLLNDLRSIILSPGFAKTSVK